MGQLQVPTKSPLHLDAGDRGRVIKDKSLRLLHKDFGKLLPSLFSE